jgi:hypothetical protein
MLNFSSPFPPSSPLPAGATPPPAAHIDDAEFDARWGASLAGVASKDVEEAVEHMKVMCGDIMLCLQGAATPHMLAVMAQTADQLFATVNAQLLRVFAAAEAAGAAGGGQPPSRGAKYALNVMLQGLNVPEIASGLAQVNVVLVRQLLFGMCTICTLLLLSHYLLLTSFSFNSLNASLPVHTQPIPHPTPSLQATLRESISLLLLRLLDDKGLLHFEEGSTLVKAVNVLMLKILETR